MPLSERKPEEDSEAVTELPIDNVLPFNTKVPPNKLNSPVPIIYKLVPKVILGLPVIVNLLSS